MPRNTRNSKSTTEDNTEISEFDKMAAKPAKLSKPDPSLQDVLDKMTAQMASLQKKIEGEIEENTKKVTSGQNRSRNWIRLRRTPPF